MDSKLKKLLKQYDVFETIENNKLRCTLTKHELPRKLDVVKAYVDTKKFQNAYGISQIMHDHPDLFEDVGDGQHVKCAITGLKIAKRAEDMKRYLNGKTFKDALIKAQQELNDVLHHEDEDSDEEAGLEDVDSDEEMEEEVEDDEDEDVEGDEDVQMSSEKEETPPPAPQPGRKRPVAATGNLKLKPNGRAKKKRN